MARITKAIKRWFEMEGDEDGARVEIKALNPGEKAEIAAASLDARLVYETGGGQMKTEHHLNPKAEMEITAKLAVTRWENFFGMNGKPLACNKANVVRAVREIEGFAQFVGASLQRLTADLAEEAEEQEKNS